MDDIITDLRALAERGKSVEHVEDVDFETVARDAWTTVGTDEATLQIETGGTVVADRSRLRSILENLFRNSVEHAGTSVSCRTGVTDDGFYVVDDGPGVPEDERETVFEYGYTTEAEGSGLGLAIVETMVAAHGWEIAVTEGDDGGAKFTVSAATIQRASPKQ
jgi:signal transduction histidine kinase